MAHVPGFPRRPVPVCAALIAACAFTPTALQASPSSASACLSLQAQEQLLRKETALLGSVHAAEHAKVRAQQCDIERGVLPVPTRSAVASPETTLQEDAEVIQAATDAVVGVRTMAGGAAQQAAATASKVGRWSSPFVIPVVGITSVLLNTGNVLFWSYDPVDWYDPAGPNNGLAYIWNPSTRIGRSIAPPENIWCGGQTILADGRVFIAGGNLRYPDPSITNGTGGQEGSLGAYTFNPLTETFTKQPDMLHGRWYPTTTQLADNRVVITSGYDESGSEALNRFVEVFTPSAAMDGIGTLQAVGTHDSPGLYPLQYLLPSAKMLEVPQATTQSGYQLDSATWNWSSAGAMLGDHYAYPNGISYTDATASPARQTIMVAGGGKGANSVRAGNEWLDGTNPASGWRDFPQWLQPRRNSNTVILPDGTLLTMGGNQSLGNYDPVLLQAELYSRPATDRTGSWQEVAAPALLAAYHSSAILLPDATVLLSEDDRDKSVEAASGHRVQIYSPPYLFKGPRPQITSAPAKIGYQSPSQPTFAINVDRTGVTGAVLIAPAATTHGNDMHQRAVKLSVAVRGTTLTVKSPPSAALVPPGYYMLFVLDKTGIPSVAKFVQVS